MVYYFAYGKNLSEKVMKERIGREVKGEKGVLEGFELVFNKRASKPVGAGYANVINNPEKEVQGAIYEVEEAEISKLDSYEGYPNHYQRVELNVTKDDGKEERCIVYIANSSKIGSELKPTKDYKSYLLKGKKFMDDDYYTRLENTETFD